jgi:outer membrane protein OmpA-like peptidoglycan-associated protein
MRTLAALPLILAMTTPAAAAPIVWHKVSDNKIDDEPAAAAQLHAERSAVEDREVAVERRKIAIDMARGERKDAREDRKMARKDRNEARRDWRKAKRGKGDLAVATMRYEGAQRAFLESKDQVDLDKEHVSFAKSQKKLAKFKEKRATARLELAEAQLVDKKTDRFERQFARIAEKTAEQRSEHELARVAVAELHQDYLGWEDVDVTVMSVAPAPRDETYVVMPGTAAGLAAGAESYEDEMSYDDGGSWSMVSFDLGSAELDKQDRKILDETAAWLKTHRGEDITLEGHTDKTGSYAFNRELAWDRADAVANYLISKGVWPSQLTTEAYGETDPLIDTQKATAWNRRVELVSDDYDATADAGN